MESHINSQIVKDLFKISIIGFIHRQLIGIRKSKTQHELSKHTCIFFANVRRSDVRTDVLQYYFKSFIKYFDV